VLHPGVVFDDEGIIRTNTTTRPEVLWLNFESKPCLVLSTTLEGFFVELHIRTNTTTRPEKKWKVGEELSNCWNLGKGIKQM
jgi:hypothetical protein